MAQAVHLVQVDIHQEALLFTMVVLVMMVATVARHKILTLLTHHKVVEVVRVVLHQVGHLETV